MARVIKLSGPWQWQGIHAQGTRYPKVDAALPQTAGQAMLRAGWLAPVDVGLGSLAGEWVQNRAWSLSTTFARPSGDEEKFYLELCQPAQDGVVLLNGREVGGIKRGVDACLHVTAALREAENALEIIFDGEGGLCAANLRGVSLARIETLKPKCDARGGITCSLRIEAFTAGRYVVTYHIMKDDEQITSFEFSEHIGADVYDYAHFLQVPDAQAWTMDHPDCYTILLTVSRGGLRCDRVNTSIGFKDVQLPEDTGLVVSKQRVLLAGVSWEETPYQQEQVLREKLSLLRSAGINFLHVKGRKSEALYQACDEMGFLVWQEQTGAQQDIGAHVCLLDESIPACRALGYYAGPDLHTSLLISQRKSLCMGIAQVAFPRQEELIRRAGGYSLFPLDANNLLLLHQGDIDAHLVRYGDWLGPLKEEDFPVLLRLTRYVEANALRLEIEALRREEGAIGFVCAQPFAKGIVSAALMDEGAEGVLTPRPAYGALIQSLHANLITAALPKEHFEPNDVLEADVFVHASADQVVVAQAKLYDLWGVQLGVEVFSVRGDGFHGVKAGTIRFPLPDCDGVVLLRLTLTQMDETLSTNEYLLTIGGQHALSSLRYLLPALVRLMPEGDGFTMANDANMLGAFAFAPPHEKHCENAVWWGCLLPYETRHVGKNAREQAEMLNGLW